jgi:CBS domain-containing protein
MRAATALRCGVTALVTALTQRARQALAKAHVLSAPLMVFPTLRDTLGESLADEGPERATYLGFVDALDLLSGLISALPASVGVGAAAWREALEEAAPRFLSRTLVTLPTHGDGEVVWAATTGMSLGEVIASGFLAGLSLRHGAASRRVTHRIAIFDERGTITDVLSQSDVVRFLAATPDALSAFGDASVESLRLGHARGAVACVGAGVPAVEAFAHMLRADCSALGVVDAAGALVGNISASDLRGTVGARLSWLAEPVGRLVGELRAHDGAGTHPHFRRGRSRERSRERSLEPPGARETPRRRLSRSPSPVPLAPPAVTCEAHTPFRDVVARLAASGVHRIYVVDAQRKPTGVITLTDVLKAVAAMEAP